MTATREILTDLLQAAARPRTLAGLLFCLAVLATLFPLIDCPCTTMSRWLFPLSTVGCVVWFGTASFLAVGPPSMEERVVWIVFTLAAPLAYVFVLAGFVPR